MREILGQEAVLKKFTQQSGKTTLSDANVHWWILEPNRKGHGRQLVASHTACINQEELFDIAEGRSSRAVHFGVFMGKENVVIYVEPESGKYVQNTARTGLVERDGSPLPWSRWEDEFRDNMPKELDDYVKKKLGEVTTESHAEKIRDRLKSIASFFKISRYRADTNGNFLADSSSEVKSLTGESTKSDTSESGGLRKKKGALPGGFEDFLMSGLKDGGVPSEEVSPDKFPQLTWVSVEEGTRDKEEMEDRAAQYLPKDNMILANADFQGFKDVIEHFAEQYSEIDGAVIMVTDVVQEVFEQLLIETVTGAQSLKNRPKWRPEEFERAVSEEALTAAVMSRYFLLIHVKRQLGDRFKSIKLASVVGAN